MSNQYNFTNKQTKLSNQLMLAAHYLFFVNMHGDTCLMQAVFSNCSTGVLQAIIDHGADVNATEKDNYTALMIACFKRHVDAIHALLKVGSDTNIVEDDGWTCLMYAVYKNCSKEVLQAIIDHGADVNATDKNNYTALISACEQRDVDAIHVLLKAGSDTNNVDEDGWTCLMYAVDNNCSNEVLQAIIDHGADVNASNKNNYTALMIAREQKHVDAIHVLLKAGFNTNIVDEDGWTCLMYAVDNNCSNEVLQAIIDHGADVNATNKRNCTALMLACEKGDVDAIHVLLKAGSDTNIVNEDGLTCLMYAVDNNCSEDVLQTLTDHGADVNATKTIILH